MSQGEPDLKGRRDSLLRQVQRVADGPMAVLGFVWLGLLVVELLRGESPALSNVSLAIWIVFVAEFVLELWIAPRKGHFLRRNWPIVLSLLLPAARALRVLRVTRALRLFRGLRVARLVTALNRGLRSLRVTMRRRGLAYVLVMSVIVMTAGAAGMLAFEREGPRSDYFSSYAVALWWTSMVMTSLGPEVWPATTEGRLLMLVISVYAFALFGYITAALASAFVGRDRQRPPHGWPPDAPPGGPR